MRSPLDIHLRDVMKHVKSRPMKRPPFLFLPAIVACAALVGCSSLNSTGSVPVPTKFSHPRDITNPYLPLASLNQDILENKNERVERTAKRDIHKTFSIGGQTVEALAVEDREFSKGGLSEVTLDYFAQSDDGTVYYLGEDVDEYKNGAISGHSGGWLLGKDTETPGVIMPAHPKHGDKFMFENVPKITWEKDEVVAVSETVTVTAGTYQNCVKIRESTSDGVEYKYYAPGVGCIEEMETDGDLPLRSHSTL